MTSHRPAIGRILPPGMVPGAPRRNVLVGIGYLFVLYVAARLVLAALSGAPVG